MEGVINFYFPCKLKNSSALKKLERRWKNMRKKQERKIKLSNRPLTDLIFKQQYRDDAEAILKEYQKTLGGYSCECSRPHALPCIQHAYQLTHEDYIFSKNASVVLSHVRIKYQQKIDGESDIKDVEATLLLNVNAENKIATYIMAVHFSDFYIDDCIFLTHLFFKNSKVKICESKSKMDSCCMGAPQYETRDWNETTLRDYIVTRLAFINKELSGEIDFRCRYTYMDITGLKDLNKRELYGLVKTDERWRLVKDDDTTEIKELSFVREERKSYISGYHLLVIHFKELPKYPYSYEVTKSYIDTNEQKLLKYDIAGIGSRQYAQYLKTVELHYLINSENTNEMGARARSFVNPWKYTRRAIRLWDIIYEVDSSKYYISKEYQENFGITDTFEELKQEFNNILMLAVGQASALIALASLLFTIVSLLK